MKPTLRLPLLLLVLSACNGENSDIKEMPAFSAMTRPSVKMNSTRNPVLNLIMSPEVITAVGEDPVLLSELAVYEKEFESSLISAARDYDTVAGELLVGLASLAGDSNSRIDKDKVQQLVEADARLVEAMVTGLVRIQEILGQKGRVAFMEVDEFSNTSTFFAMLEMLISSHLVQLADVVANNEAPLPQGVDALLLKDDLRRRELAKAIADVHLQAMALEPDAADFLSRFKELSLTLDAPRRASIEKRMDLALQYLEALSQDQRLQSIVTPPFSDYFGLTVDNAPLTMMFTMGRPTGMGGGMPGGAMPGGAMPGGAMPGGAMPGGAMPGGAMPGGAMPGGAMPGGATPGGGTQAPPPSYQ